MEVVFVENDEPIFASAFEHAVIGMALLKPDGQFLRVNPSLCNFLGYSMQELQSLTYQQITHPDDLMSDLANAQRMLKGEIETYRMEKRYIHKAGHPLWAVLSASLVRDADGQPRYFVSQIIDINARKQAEEALRTNHERLEFVIQGIDAALWDWNLATDEVVFNERWAGILGYTLAELEPVSLDTWNRLAHPSDLQRSNELLARHFASETPHYECEIRMQHKDGHWVWVLDRGKVVEWDAAGKPTRMTGIHLDITERKEEEIRAEHYVRLYSTLSQVNQAIVHTTDRHSLFTQICDMAVKYGHFSLVWIAEVDRETGNVRAVAAAGEHTSYVEDPEINIHNPNSIFDPVHKALRDGKLTLTQDIAPDPEMMRRRATALAHGFHAGAAIPIRQRGEVVAALCLYTAEQDFFRPQEQMILTAMGDDISIALDSLQSELEAQSTQQLFSHLFQLSPLATALMRLSDQKYVDVNQAFVDLLGHTRADTIGRTNIDLNICAIPQHCQEIMEHLHHRGPVRDAEFDFFDAAGNLHKGLLYADLISYNGETFILSNTVDITERTKAEESLRKSEQTQRLQVSALEAAANAIVITDYNGTIEWCNSAFTTLTGYEKAEALGKNPRELIKSDKQDSTYFHELWQTILAGNVWRGELTNRRKDGTEYLEDQTITPVVDETGQVTHFVAIKTDITRERERQVQSQRQERLAAVGQLAAGIAHDFNNIMAVIVLYSQMTAQSTLLSERERQRLLTIREQAEHAAHMIRQILDFSRQGDMEPQPLDLYPLLKEQVKLLKRTLPENIDIVFDVATDEYVINADATRIQQTLMNLAVNARDAMPRGGKIEFRLKRVYADESNTPIAEMEPGPWICLSIADTGTGIPSEFIPHLFEPFFTTKPVGKGTGLGLPQVHGIVSDHGGHITVESQVGKGATFSIYLPELMVEHSFQLATTALDLPQGNRETVLLVEDNQAVRTAIGDVLQQLNYCVTEASNGEEALGLLTNGTQADVILTDLVMPKKGGVELVRALHKQASTIPIVIMTGHPLNNDTELLQEFGLDTWLKKPPTQEELCSAIRDALHRQDA